MSEDGWTPWTLAAIGLAVVMAAALITGLVVANWTGPVPMAMLPAAVSETTEARLPPAGRRLPPGAVPPAILEPIPPPEAIVEACNEYAGTQDGQLDTATEVAYRAAYAICLRASGYWKYQGRVP